MEIREYERLARFEGFYWWHVGRRDIVRRVIEMGTDDCGLDVLEVGCGTGGNLDLLEEFGSVTGIDSSPTAIEFCRQRGHGNVEVQDCLSLDFPDEKFDLVVALDLLEHLDDPEAALLEFRRVLKPGGRLVLTVPAYQFLWSGHDVSLHHRKRYRLREVERLVIRVGLRVRIASYIISALAVPIMLVRAIEKATTATVGFKKGSSYIVMPKAVNDLFVRLLRLEGRLLRRFRLPFGTSIICVAVRGRQESDFRPT